MTTNSVRRVGMIGLGKMGLPMARHLRKRGFEVSAYDINATACKAAEALGVKFASNARSVATDSDFVIVVVGFDAEVEGVVTGVDGIIAAKRSDLIVGIASTIAPRTMKKLGMQLSGTGISLLDMPLTRGEPAAELEICLSWSVGIAQFLRNAGLQWKASPAAYSISGRLVPDRSERWSIT